MLSASLVCTGTAEDEPTAITEVEAESRRVILVYENGRIIIISGCNKYSISGRKP